MTAIVNTAVGGVEQTGGELFAVSATAVMVNGNTIFTATGEVEIHSLYSECITANGATASTLQYSITPTATASATTISGASSSLANATVGTFVALDGTALSTAPNVYTNGVGLSQTSRGIIFPTGVMTIVVGVGSTTGTWRHYLLYTPRETGAYVY